VKVETLKLTFDLLVGLDRTNRASYNREKLPAYDDFLCGWCLEHPRYKTLGTRPVVLFVCRDQRSLLGCAKAADEALTGRIGITGAPADQWYYPAREHLLFAREADIHRGRVSAFALPSVPPYEKTSMGIGTYRSSQCCCCQRRRRTRHAETDGSRRPFRALRRCRRWCEDARAALNAGLRGPPRGCRVPLLHASSSRWGR
jgi:hypothetical protein